MMACKKHCGVIGGAGVRTGVATGRKACVYTRVQKEALGGKMYESVRPAASMWRGGGNRHLKMMKTTTSDVFVERTWGRFDRYGGGELVWETQESDVVGQLIAGAIVLSSLAPSIVSGSGPQPSISTICLSMTSSLYYLWGAVKLLPAWKTALKERKEADQKKIVSGAMLVAGGTVGAGIVALPVKTSIAGVLPSAASLVGGWGFMLLSALMILEVSKHCGPGANFTSMAEQTLGPRWKALSAVLYIFVYSATLTAYIAESATFLSPAVLHALGATLPKAVLSMSFAALLGSIISLGSKAVDTTNSLCVAVALSSFAFLLGFGGNSVSATSLLFANWGAAAKMMPLMVVAFTFHNMIPSLLTYLGSARAVRKALVIGTFIPLMMYLAWEVLILGSLPPGAAMGSVSDVLCMIGCNGTISTAINVFSLFAIITSFLGVGMGCIDFLKDLLGKTDQQDSGGWLTLATIGVPTMVACLCPQLFLPALEISGILRLILFTVIPALMMMKGPLSESKWKGHAIAVTFTTLATMIIGIDVAGRLSLI